MKHLYKFFIVASLLFANMTITARPYMGDTHQVKQPDGNLVTVKLYGDEFYMDAESEDGYTVVVDDSSKYVCYASVSSDGKEYTSTGIIYDGREVPSLLKNFLKPHLRISEESVLDKRNSMKNSRSITEKTTSLRSATAFPDTIYGVCVLIDFPDVKSDVSREQFVTFLNSDNEAIFGNSMSVKKYFQWISGGKLTYINYVPQNFYTAENNFSYYSPSTATDYTTDLFYPVIEKALKSYTKEKDGFEVTDLSTKDGAIRAINIYYAGTCTNKWATGLWPHQSGYQFDLTEFGFYRWDYHSYQMSDIGTELKLGTIVHENVHLICGWPDFYTYDGHSDNNATVYNIGDAFSIYSEKSPAYPNPWALDQMGWLSNKIDITDYDNGRLVTLTEGVGNVAVYRGGNNSSKEKYYLEIRDGYQTDYWNRTDEHGIFIWHSNDAGDNTTEGNAELLDCKPATTNNPFWSKNNGPEVFCDSLIPYATWVNGNASGAYLWDFSESGETMTFRCGKISSDVSVSEVEVEPCFSIYKNVDAFELVAKENLSVVIFNINGIVVEQFKVEGDAFVAFGADYNKGVYLVRLSNENFSKIVRLIR